MISITARLTLLLFTLLSAAPAWACAVCGVGENETSNVFFYSTIALSVVPLTLMGGILTWIWRVVKRSNQHVG